MKKKKFILKIIFASLSLIAIVGGIIGLSIANHIAFVVYPNNLTQFFNQGSGDTSSYSEESNAKGNNLAKDIVKEGSVLVKNNGTLPLDKNVTKKVNVFGYNSMDWYYSGSGSGQVYADGETQYNICLALDHYGIEYNTELYNFYCNYREPTGAVNPWSLEGRAEKFYILCEPDLTNDIKRNAESFSKTAIVCIGRKAGESEDAPLAQYKYNRETDYTKTYLEASDEEIALLNYVTSGVYDNVIVLINSTNQMQLDFLETIQGIDACLIVGNTGNYGANGICDLLYGEASPSGKLTDTYPFDLKTNITYYHGGYQTTGRYQNSNSRAWPYNRNYKSNDWQTEGTVFYQDYIEGIYVGYKWYETADAEGYWDNVNNAFGEGYGGVVQFPFGYGKSYTEFEWEVSEVTLPDNSEITSSKQEITFKVKVKNVGRYPGKDVVEIYLTAPYDKANDGIEKAYVSLVGFNKTPLINPDNEIYIDITVRVSDFESYDCYDKNHNDHVGYELDRGNYELKFMTDSHHFKEMEHNTYTYVINDTINIDNDEVTNQKVTNLFTGDVAVDGLSIDGSNANQNIQYISRKNFPALPTEVAPHRNWDNVLEVTPNSECVNTYSTSKASEWDNKTGNDAFGNPISTSAPHWGNGSGTNKVIQNGAITDLGRELADPTNWNSNAWNKILDQISFDEAVNVTCTNALGTSQGVASAGRPNGSDADGPQQIGTVAGLGSGRGKAYPNGTLIGQTWSRAIGLAFGKSYAYDMQMIGRTGAYAFGCNIHRNAFAGRNFEYFSEDAYLSGQIGAQETKGAAINGKYCYMKHFVCNDQEYYRVGLYTWLTEQALREIYLKPFKECVQYGELTAIMSSFNRVGATWAGGSEALLTGVLRNEWGFHGMVITDYCESSQMMDQAQAIRAGSNYGMSMTYTYGCFNTNPTLSSSSVRFQNRLMDATKEVIYGYIRPLLVNYEYKRDGGSDAIMPTAAKKPWEFWRPLVITIDFVFGSAFAFWAYAAIKPLFIRKEDLKAEDSNND